MYMLTYISERAHTMVYLYNLMCLMLFRLHSILYSNLSLKKRYIYILF